MIRYVSFLLFNRKFNLSPLLFFLLQFILLEHETNLSLICSDMFDMRLMYALSSTLYVNSKLVKMIWYTPFNQHKMARSSYHIK